MKKAIIINDTSYDYHHGCEFVMYAIERMLEKRDISIIASCPVGVHFREVPQLVSKLPQADLVIINGEGTIHHGREKAAWLLEAGAYAKSLGIPVALINATLQDNPKSFNEKIALFNLVCVRETMSANEIDGINCHIVPDLTMLLPDLITLPNSTQRTNIGITDGTRANTSIDAFNTAKIKHWQFVPVLRSYRREHKLLWLERLRYFKYLAIKAALHCKILDDSDNNYLIARNLYIHSSLHAYLAKIASLDMLLTGRFHAMCFALITETPFLAAKGNSHKVESMLTDIGIDKRFISHDEMLKFSLDTPYTYSDKEIEAIRHYKKQAIDKIHHMFDQCTKLIKQDTNS